MVFLNKIIAYSYKKLFLKKDNTFKEIVDYLIKGV
jgi:hypothetical protein